MFSINYKTIEIPLFACIEKVKMAEKLRFVTLVTG